MESETPDLFVFNNPCLLDFVCVCVFACLCELSCRPSSDPSIPRRSTRKTRKSR